MAVKDLVSKFEANSTQDRRRSTPPERAEGTTTSQTQSASPSRTQTDAESNASPATGARFLRHPLFKGHEPSRHSSKDIGLPLSTESIGFHSIEARENNNDPFHDPEISFPSASSVPSLTNTNIGAAPPKYTQAIANTSPERPTPPHEPNSHFKRWLDSTPENKAEDEEGSEYEMLLSKRTPYVPDSPSTVAPPYISLASLASPPPLSRGSTTNDFESGTARLHAPIPFSQIAARNAPPLHIPALDKYIESLPAPEFERWITKDGHEHGHKPRRGEGMFPPMDRLAATKSSIEDLETNTHVPTLSEQGLLKSFVNFCISLAGSSAMGSYYSLQGVFNTIQIFALLLRTLVPYHATGLGEKWRQLFLGTIPNVLALNFASTAVQSLLLLLIFLVITTGLLLYFRHVTNKCEELQHLEGLQTAEPKEYGLLTVAVTFLLTVIYLPVSTMAVHVLVWSDDLWVVPNPYLNATTFPPILPALGPTEKWRDPLDFCYTTTMHKNSINWAPILVIVALVVSAMLTVWFPVRLYKTLQLATPDVDKYNEFGVLRSTTELDREYQRLLDRDDGPFSFLYREFRRGWGTYESYYLLAKFIALLVVAVLAPDNCFFRTLNRNTVAIVQKGVLLAATLIFFGVQCWLVPFLDPVSNASEWFSRGNYVFTSILSLLVALGIPGKAALNGWVLYVNYAITYSLSFYFVIITTGLVQQWIKRLSGRLDFSIDIFSPRLDISRTSHHVRRRVWQESITTLFLTSPTCHIPREQKMRYAHAPDSEYAPYLLNFVGTPAERHVENLKIFRELGSTDYAFAVTLTTGADAEWFLPIAVEIQRHFVGPDCYWRDPAQDELPGCTQYFGNAWWIPFPPTIVLQYDDGPLVTIKDPHSLAVYLAQNRSLDIRRRRDIRMALRSLDGRVVAWPYTHIEPVGGRSSWFGSRYKASEAVHYQHATLRITQRGRLIWEKLELGSGFIVELYYSKKLILPASVFGLDDDYDLTPSLARFLQLNERLVPDRLAHVENVLEMYKLHHLRECDRKLRTLSYKFLSIVFNRPEDILDLVPRAAKDEHDERAQQLLLGKTSAHAFAAAHDRMVQIASSEVATWWYLFWDDVWRRNHTSIKQLRVHQSDFSPHYPTSIAYAPLPRAALEAFLAQRGLLHRPSKRSDFFHSGTLNKVYLRLNDVAFHGSRRARVLHLGNEPDLGEEGDFADLDAETLGAPSSLNTLGTGAGTDHDDDVIRARPAYRWEGILADKYQTGRGGRRSLSTKIAAWMGISPVWAEGLASSGIAVDARLDNGRYVLIQHRRRTQDMDQ